MILQLRIDYTNNDQESWLEGEPTRTHRTASGGDADSVSSEVWNVEQSDDVFADKMEQTLTTSRGVFDIESTFLSARVDGFGLQLAKYIVDSDVKWISATAVEPLASPEFAQFPCAEKIGKSTRL